MDLGLSREEDSVTSLAFAKTTDTWASAFAGINSALKEQEAGNNQHLRSFLLQYPSRRGPANEEADAEEKETYKPEAKALGKASYFTATTGPKPETFQRVLRLSKPYKENAPRLGAVATGLAPEGEIVTFVADTNKPTENDIRHRIKLGKKEEAADIDIVAIPKPNSDIGESDFVMAYCTDYDIWLTKIHYKYDRPKKLDPQCIHSNPHPDVFASTKARPKFRSLRFLTPTLLLILQNLPYGKGSELLLMETSGAVRLRKRLHRKIKSGTAMSLSALPFTTPGSKRLARIQQVVAVAGADNSVTVMTLDHAPNAPYRGLKFQSQLFWTDVHPTSITSLTLSTHTPPTIKWSQTPPQYLKLASTSIANTVVVHTLPLTPYPSANKETDEPATYILSVPGATTTRIKENVFSFLVASLLISFVSILMQSYLEIFQGTREVLGARKFYSQSWEERFSSLLAIPYLSDSAKHAPWLSRGHSPNYGSQPLETFYGAMPTSPSSDPSFSTDPAEPASDPPLPPTLRDLLASRRGSRDTDNDAGPEQHILVSHPPAHDQSSHEPAKLEAALHHPEHIQSEHSAAKKWEDLTHHEKQMWKGRLKEAGQWAVEEGEAVLKGVFFGGLAQGVGAAVGG